MKPEPPIAIAGAGRVAQALGRLLRERGVPVAAVASRDPGHAAAAAEFIGGAAPVTYDCLPCLAAHLIIAVPDDALGPVAELLAAAAPHGEIAVHTSGAKGPEALAPLACRGFSCATLHPLQTISTPRQGLEALPGVAFAIAGDDAAAIWAERIVHLLSGHALRIPADLRPVYHAAAVMASNYVLALIDAALALMAAAGVEAGEALPALAPLIRASTENALRQGPVDALTGPIERGDCETVAAHLRALAVLPEQLSNLYRAAGLQALDIARRRGLPPEKASTIEQALREGGTPKCQMS